MIGLNLLWLVPGVVGGSEEYTVRLLRAFDRLDADDIELRLYCQPALIEQYPDLAGRFEAIPAPHLLRSKFTRIAADNTWLTAVSRHDRLLHHAGSVAPPTNRRPFIFTVHDMQPLDHPEYLAPLRRAWQDRMLPPSIQRAELILCPSEFTKSSILRHEPIDPDRIHVVPHGHDPVTPGVLDPSTDAELARRFGRFLLLPGITYPHKRHADLVRVLDLLRDDHPALSVVFTGREGPAAPAVRDLVSERGLEGRVHWLGRVPEDTLDQLFRSAAALVFPSEYEGFGNPALEAMARGCPVVTTTSGSLPEVVGDAGLLVPARSVEALTAATRRVLEDDTVADRLREAGPLRAQEFGWRRAGVALVEAYRVALDRSVRRS